MDELKKFIAAMREKKLSDELIYKNLLQKGWDEKLVNEAFLPDDAAVPVPTKTAEKPVEKTPRPGTSTDASKASDVIMISKAESVLHHIFLWVFSITYIINVQVIFGVLNRSYIDSNETFKTVASSLAALAITGVIYGVFYIRFLKKFKQNSALKFHGGWNLATIILGSLTGISALIGLVAAMIWVDNIEEVAQHLLPVVVYAGLVVLNYSKINFGKSESLSRKRYVGLFYWLFILLTIMAALAYVGFCYLNRKSDIDLKESMAKVVRKNYRYYVDNHRIAKKLAELDIDASNIDYKISDSAVYYSSFEMCGNFRHADTSYKNYSSSDVKDVYVYDDDFRPYQLLTTNPGRNCFKINLRVRDYSLD